MPDIHRALVYFVLAIASDVLFNVYSRVCCDVSYDVSYHCTENGRVKDTLGHTSTPAFSVDSELLRYFPGHADAVQILLYGVSPVLSWSSRFSFCTAYIPVYSFLGSLLSICRTCPSHPSLLSYSLATVMKRPRLTSVLVHSVPYYEFSLMSRISVQL